MGDARLTSGKAISTVKLLRPIFLLGGASMNLFGVALAFHLDARIDWTSLFAFQAVLVTLQLSGHAANDYADFESDSANRNRTWFSGGSGMLPAGRISMTGAMRISAVFAAITVMMGIAFAVVLDWNPLVVVLLIIGLGGALQYSLRPLKLAYRGAGEVFMMFFYGSICADAAFIVQTGAWNDFALVGTLPLMVQVVIVMLLTEYPDLEADTKAGKKNLVVRIGRDNIRKMAFLLIPAGIIVATLGAFGGMSIVNGAAVSLIFLAEGATVAVILGKVRSGRLGYNWLTSSVIAFLVLMTAVSVITL